MSVVRPIHVRIRHDKFRLVSMYLFFSHPEQCRKPNFLVHTMLSTLQQAPSTASALTLSSFFFVGAMIGLHQPGAKVFTFGNYCCKCFIK